VRRAKIFQPGCEGEKNIPLLTVKKYSKEREGASAYSRDERGKREKKKPGSVWGKTGDKVAKAGNLGGGISATFMPREGRYVYKLSEVGSENSTNSEGEGSERYSPNCVSRELELISKFFEITESEGGNKRDFSQRGVGGKGRVNLLIRGEKGSPLNP